MLPLAPGFADFDNHVRTIGEAVGPVTSRITSVEQTVNALVAKMALFAAMEHNTSTLTENVGSGSASSWNLLGHSDGSTATGFLGSDGPGSSDDNRNTRRRPDTFSSPEDEHARSAVLLRFPCEQYHTGVTNWINNLWEKSNIQAFHKPVRIHCKTGGLSARLVFNTRAKCQDFVARHKDDGIPTKLTVHFCQSSTIFTVRQSKTLEDREIGKTFAPLWNVLAEKLKIHFPEGDDTGTCIVPAIDVRSQVLSITMTITSTRMIHLAHSLISFFLEKAERWTVSELLRKTPDSLGAKLLTASTALRAYRNRHLGTLVRCCEAWDPVGECFDPNSFECIDFHALSQIIASLTRESLAEREAETCNLPWTQTENTMPWRSADLDFALGVPRNQCSASTPLPMKTAILWKTKMNQAGDYVNIGVQSFGARVDGERHRHCENILRYVQKAPDDIRWELDKNEFDELMATKKESAPGPGGIPYSFYRCARGLGWQVLFNAYKHVLEGGTVLA